MRLVLSDFISLDGVVQAPGAADVVCAYRAGA